MLFTQPIPLSLYIHLPWCVQKCPYCDFNSHANTNNLQEELYINALLNDLEQQLPKIWGRRFVSIFFGGGTPSLFSPASIEKILSSINARIPFHRDIEITLEANPGTVDESRFKGFKSAGINRLSIGIQSLQNEKLKLLGRIHDREHALRAIEKATTAGFENFNIDLMHGLPQQSLTDALEDIQDALQFTPPHFSWYQLTIEPNTVFYKNPPALPPDDVLYEIQDAGKKLLSENNLSQYEVSAYAKKNHECIHNKNYWEFGDYIGIGAGAHSKITDFENSNIIRQEKMKQPKDYLNPEKSFIAKEFIVPEKEIIFEFMLNALRLTDGVPMTLFTERTGLTTHHLEPMLTIAKNKKLLMDGNNHLCATYLGQRFLNDLLQIFMS